jgi:DnaJ-class molecular chaperone
VSDAYAVLHDPSKRRHYDLHGSGAAGDKVGLEAVEVENVGFLGRFLAAQIAKLGKVQGDCQSSVNRDPRHPCRHS